MSNNKLGQLIGITLSGGILAACGGGGGGADTVSSSSTPSAVTASSVGTITGFGSVYVNGVKFETDGTEYLVDDEDAFDDSALAVGMKVKVIGTINEDGVSGHAEKIIYDDDVEGPIDAASLDRVDADTVTFSIFGLPVRAHAKRTVYDDGASFATLAEGQVIEVSGYFDGNDIIASRIEDKTNMDDLFELKGTVTAYDSDSLTLSLLNGNEAGPFDIDPGALLEIPPDPIDQFVELKLAGQGSNLVVVEIESDDDNLPDDTNEEVHMHGILAQDDVNGYLINGMPVGINAGTGFSPESLENRLAAGMEISIEGKIRDGVMVADEIESKAGNIEIDARIVDISSSSAKSGSLTLDLGNGQALQVHTDNTTLFKDNSASDLDDDGSFNLGELAAGSDFTEIEAYRNAAGDLIASRIKREDSDHKTALKAPLEAFEPGASITMLGIHFAVGLATQYEIDGNDTTDAKAFFRSLSIGDTVKAEDENADGTAEVAGLDN